MGTWFGEVVVCKHTHWIPAFAGMTHKETDGVEPAPPGGHNFRIPAFAGMTDRERAITRIAPTEVDWGAGGIPAFAGMTRGQARRPAPLSSLPYVSGAGVPACPDKGRSAGRLYGVGAIFRNDQPSATSRIIITEKPTIVAMVTVSIFASSR